MCERQVALDKWFPVVPTKEGSAPAGASTCQAAIYVSNSTTTTNNNNNNNNETTTATTTTNNNTTNNTSTALISIYVYTTLAHKHIYIYIYIYMHTHTHVHVHRTSDRLGSTTYYTYCYTTHIPAMIYPPSEIDGGLLSAVFAGSEGKSLFHRIG